ncbi:MAG: TRAP transporter substrate-binding protein DctP [Desulfobacterales bacterium]
MKIRQGFSLKLLITIVGMIFCYEGVAQGLVFKIGTISPEGSVWMDTMREGAGRVAKETENRVQFKFYPGGVMGSDQAVLRKIRIGQLQGGAIVAGSISHIYPDIMVYGLPFLFKSYEEVDYVRERMDSLLGDGLEENGFVTFGIAEGGFVYVMSDSPIRTVSDLAAKKVWIPDNDFISLEAVRAFGITPITLSIGEVRTGLQTGLINTIGTSPIGALALQWHTQVNYVMDVPLMYVYATMILDKKTFSRLSLQDQNVVRNVMNQIFRDLDKINRRDNLGALNALENQGIEFVRLSDDTIRNWKDTVSEVPQRLIEKDLLSSEIYQTLKEYLGDYRSKKNEAILE